MVRGVRAMGMGRAARWACSTRSGRRLAEAGLSAYNQTSTPRDVLRIISTARLRGPSPHLGNIRKAGITVCSGIIGMGSRSTTAAACS
jgi:biotin synthase-like enzyme